MGHRHIAAAVAALVLVILVSMRASEQEVRAVHGHHLTVYVEGVRNSVGTIGYLVFDSKRGWPDTMADALRGDMVPARAGTTVLKVADLPAGNYGVLVIHDENGNSWTATGRASQRNNGECPTTPRCT